MSSDEVKRNLRFEKLKPEHAVITPYLRQADIDELKALTGLAPNIGTAFSIAFTQRGYAAFYENKDIPAAIFGISDGLIWLVGTDEITKHPVTFFRATQKYFPDLVKGYDYIYNYVDARNKLHLRWLKWLGFTIEEAKILGVEKRPFHRIWYNFSKGDKNV